MPIPKSSLIKKSSFRFTTREVNPWVLSPGLIALFAFSIILRHVPTFGQSSTSQIALFFYGTIAFALLLSPLFTTIVVTEDRIDWKVFGRFGTVIYFDEIREMRIHHRLFVKLDTGKWWKPTICPIDRDGFLRAIRKAKPNLTIKGWNHPYARAKLKTSSCMIKREDVGYLRFLKSLSPSRSVTYSNPVSMSSASSLTVLAILQIHSSESLR
jgi:hypothetical protein